MISTKNVNILSFDIKTSKTKGMLTYDVDLWL